MDAANSAFAVAVIDERLRMRLRSGRKSSASATTMIVAASVAQAFANRAAPSSASNVAPLTSKLTAEFRTDEAWATCVVVISWSCPRRSSDWSAHEAPRKSRTASVRPLLITCVASFVDSQTPMA